MLTMVLAQTTLTVLAALDENRPVIEQRDGSGDEEAATATTIESGRDWSRPNRLRRKEYPYSRTNLRRNQQWRAEQEHTPHAPVSSRNHEVEQEWGQEHRTLGTDGNPELSMGPEISEDGDSSLLQIYRASTDPPTNGACPVALHNSNAAALKEDRDSAAPSTAIVGAFPVWARLQQAETISSRLRCPSPPCCLVSVGPTYHTVIGYQHYPYTNFEYIPAARLFTHS